MTYSLCIIFSKDWLLSSLQIPLQVFQNIFFLFVWELYIVMRKGYFFASSLLALYFESLSS